MVVRWPGGRQDSHPLLKPVLRVGRALDNDIVLDFPTVSGHHLQLDVGPAEVQVTDLNSTNGTMLKGRRIPPGTSNLWRPGETIRVGDLHGNSISMVLQGEAAPALRTYPLDMHKLAHLNQIIIGRDPASQITLAHPSVSRQHAEISRQNGGRAIRDLGSVNGTFVNGQRVTGLTPLQMGDVVQIGPYKMVYDGQAERLTTSVSLGHRLDAMGIGVQVSGGKMILQDISVTVQGSEFAALVGGSGAGKSTMMKAMNGFHPATHGRMLIDGEPLYPNMDTYRTLMGYVPQDDIIHKTLPVRSALWYSAKLRLPDATHAEIDRRIADVLDMVDMKAHAAKPVKVLSGGQRKRVSIAVELLAEPELLFLDEPTSGLDPGLEKKMMYDLNRLADQGRTVVLVTHATANIEQCNHVAFLVRGNLAYYGPPQEAISFFGTRDFADIYLKLSEEVEPNNTRQLPTEIQPYCSTVESKLGNNGGGAAATYPAGLLWAEHYRRSSIYKQYVQDRQSNLGVARQPSQPALPVKPNRTRDSALRQLFILARRQFDLIRHDVRTLFILLLMMPLIAFLFMMVSDESALSGLTGRTEEAMTEELMENLNIDDESELESGDVGEKVEYIPLQDASNLVTMLGLALTQAGTFGAAYEIVKERAIFRRERAVNLKVVSYVLSKAFVLGSFAVIQVFSVLLIMGLKLDMSFDPIFEFFPSGAAELFVTLFIAVMASIMFGLFISAVVPTQDVVLYIILIQLFTQIILSGTLFPLDNNPASKLVVSYWTMDAMGATVDLNQLNDDSLICQVGEREVPTPQGEMEKRRGIECESAARDELELPYEHTEEHLLTTWAALGLQALLWGAATMFVQSRVKGD
jgi:ABC-type multidrug transport system ATPase subunit